MSSHTPSEIRVELFVRSQAGIDARGRQQDVIGRLDRLQNAGTIREYNVVVWGREICPVSASGDTACHRFTVERLERFGIWARKQEVSLESTFAYRKITQTLTEEEFFVVVTPFLCLAVYESDELDGVYPSTVDGKEWTVEEYLAGLERGVDPRPRVQHR